MYKYLVIIILS